MIVATHQPIFLPWPGFFCKMFRADVLVLLDDVQFPRGTTWMTRNRIKSEQGELWLRVPVWKKHRGLQKIREVELCDESPWRHKHVRSIREKYANAPGISDLLPEIETLYSTASGGLASFNVALIRCMAAFLGLNRNLVLQSELGVSGKGSDLLVSICRALKADSFLILPPVEKYLDAATFQAAGIQIRLLRFRPPVYPQLWGEFRDNLSALDLLLNCGAKSSEILNRCASV